MAPFFRNIFSVILVLSIAVGWGCTAPEQVTEPNEKTTVPPADTAEAEPEEISELQTLLNNTRSKLSDLHISQTHDIPETFLKTRPDKESTNFDPYDGYRIQIIATRDVQLADSVSKEFRMWADTTIAGYTAKPYVFFKQPFYKVHIGDFQRRDLANSYSNLVKRKYPDAWVVHDRINPENVPADTASFSIIQPGERKRKINEMMNEENR